MAFHHTCTAKLCYSSNKYLDTPDNYRQCNPVQCTARCSSSTIFQSPSYSIYYTCSKLSSSYLQPLRPATWRKEGKTRANWIQHATPLLLVKQQNFLFVSNFHVSKVDASHCRLEWPELSDDTNLCFCRIYIVYIIYTFCVRYLIFCYFRATLLM